MSNNLIQLKEKMHNFEKQREMMADK
ncbi:MAG: hypothetical protein UR83_C0040G0001, partial [Candidatus Moranbacteria bacterium GW2011_GWF2_35_54]